MNIVEERHITVCICTFKRPLLLKRLLSELKNQKTEGLFSYSVVVVDNDVLLSAQQVVCSFQQTSNLDVTYCNEAVQNIALARNKAIENAQGDFIAFIDDDEFPSQNWLINLFKAQIEFSADGILGPVLPYYDTKPPRWIIEGNFHERKKLKSGTVLLWSDARTGNLLLKREILDDKQNKFRQEFGSGGEDRDFFRRMMDQGFQFVWCDEAAVFEIVPPERFKRSFMLRRALLRGSIPYNHNLISYIKSVIAIPLYTLLLPFLIIAPHHLFMKYLIKDFDHIGRILSVMGLCVIKDKYIME